MELMIDVPEKVVERAAELGLPISTFVSRLIEQAVDEPIPPGFVRLGTPTMTREEATEAILEIQRTHTLGGLKIKDLIEEGRRL